MDNSYGSDFPESVNTPPDAQLPLFPEGAPQGMNQFGNFENMVFPPPWSSNDQYSLFNQQAMTSFQPSSNPFGQFYWTPNHMNSGFAPSMAPLSPFSGIHVFPASPFFPRYPEANPMPMMNQIQFTNPLENGHEVEVDEPIQTMPGRRRISFESKEREMRPVTTDMQNNGGDVAMTQEHLKGNGTTSQPTQNAADSYHIEHEPKMRGRFFSPYQRSELMKAFEKTQFLSVKQRSELGAKIGLDHNQIRAWFRNERTRYWKSLKEQKSNSGTAGQEGH